MDFKDTINLPKTEFPMKGNLPQNEPKTIEFWNDNNIYKKMIEERPKDRPFVMPDGPPYANGNLHLGHTLNKCLKDFVIKYKNMAGYRAPFIPGWDCHGLPIEHKVTKELGKKRADKTAADIRELCRQEAKKWVGIQGEQFQRLGVVADWENPYLTLQESYEAEEVRELARILDNGIIYRGEKPVHWCYTLQTALAEAEIEYASHKSPAIYALFPMKEGLEKFNFKKPVFAVIWTTTPWTLPSNFGIALHRDFEYGFFEKGDQILFFAKDLKESVEKDCEIELKDLGLSIKGSELEGLNARHPFYDRDSKIVLGEHVTMEATGIVHTAPGHGQDDYNVGLEYGLPIFSPVDERGRYTSEVPEYEGLHVFEANPKVVARLQEQNRLLGHKEIEHSYPHNWRSKTPVIFRSTPQWFIRMDDEKFNVRKSAQGSLNEITFVPSWGVKRLTAMIDNRPDWCISRQRNWGVPIPVFYCQSCDTEHLKSETMMKIADIMEENGGIEAYFEKPIDELVGELTCEKCGSKEFRKGKDILDVWFDSGVCHAAVQSRREGLSVPADLYLEGSDQHRGWFQTSLLSSIAGHGRAPFKKLLTHNFVNDSKGRKMSKSLGNVVDPADLIKKNGAEILRLWAAAEDYGQDLNFSMESIKRVMEVYRRFRNTMRFLLGNLFDFDHKKDLVSYDQLLPLDQWALLRLNELNKKVVEHYDNYEFFRVFQLLNNFFTVDLSAHYLDMLKDRLYTYKSDGVARRSAQTVLFHLLDRLTRMLAPLASFLAEETYKYASLKSKESIFLEEFPQPVQEWDNSELEEKMTRLFAMREEATKLLEDLRKDKKIGKSLEARLILHAKGPLLTDLKEMKDHLCEFLIVSQCEIKENSGNEDLKVEAIIAPGEKCPRCWYVSEEISKTEPKVCPKCLEALK